MNNPIIANGNLQAIIRQFKSYSHAFDIYDSDEARPITLKRNHSERVAAHCRQLAISENMNEDEVNFAEALGWLHDIGRFDQWAKYKTFSDEASEDHAEMAVQLLRQLGILIYFDEHDSHVVCHSILNHNKYQITSLENALIRFYTKLLRDADKLDIWHITLNRGLLFKPQTEAISGIYQVSSEIKTCFEKNAAVPIELIRVPFDIYLFRLSWIFDLNFNLICNTVPHYLNFIKVFNLGWNFHDFNFIKLINLGGNLTHRNYNFIKMCNISRKLALHKFNSNKTFNLGWNLTLHEFLPVSLRSKCVSSFDPCSNL